MSNAQATATKSAAPKTRRKTLTPAEKLAKLEEQEAQLKAKIANEKAKISKANRKLDTRRKIIVGALALEHAEQQPQSEFASELHRLISRHVKESDKHLFEQI